MVISPSMPALADEAPDIHARVLTLDTHIDIPADYTTPKHDPGARGVAFLGPLDPFVWDRELLRSLYDFDYIWEVYVPGPKRRWGYYVLPLLFGAPPPPQLTCADLGSIAIPVTVACGADSRAFCRVAAEWAVRCIAGAGLATIPNARHLWPIEDPRGFSQLVIDWLEGH